jgi:hypothetical protein
MHGKEQSNSNILRTNKLHMQFATTQKQSPYPTRIRNFLSKFFVNKPIELGSTNFKKQARVLPLEIQIEEILRKIDTGT